MNKFNHWHNEIADMPTLQDGKWVDLETGIAYDDSDDSEQRKKPRGKVSQKAVDDRNIAKFFGGKALSGTIKQKNWAEKIRADVIKSGKLDEQQIKNLVTCGGFVDSAKFWIENREVQPEKFKAENIVAQYRGLVEIENKHRDFLYRTNPTCEKEKRKKEIKDYLATCDFKFYSSLI